MVTLSNTTINLSLHTMLKKAAFLINKCFVMSLKRRKWRRGEREKETKKGKSQPQIHLECQVIAGFGKESSGMQRGAAQSCGFRPKASRTEDTTSERFFSPLSSQANARTTVTVTFHQLLYLPIKNHKDLYCIKCQVWW